jgi:phosphatidate phosphatase APP1
MIIKTSRLPLAAALTLPLAVLLASPAFAKKKPAPQVNAKPAWIDVFSGWAGPRGGRLYARVHKGQPIAKPKPHESRYARLKETLEALEVNQLEHAKVSVAGLNGVTTAEADDHGFLEIQVPGGLPPGYVNVTLCIATPGWGGEPASISLQVFEDKVELGVISDIDDTLTDTGVTEKERLIENTLLHSEWEMKTFPSAPQAVTFLAGKADNGLPLRALFYLSGSPWALHSRIADFFDRAGFPHSAMILRRYSQEPLDPYQFKHPHLQDIFGAFPNHKWILLGDSGEKDPEIYAQMRTERGDRIENIYIHNVTKDCQSSARYNGMMLFNDWDEVLRDATAKNYGVGRPSSGAVARPNGHSERTRLGKRGRMAPAGAPGASSPGGSRAAGGGR